MGLRDGQAEQAQLTHVGHDVGRHLVVFLDGVFGGHQALADKTLHAVEQQWKGLGIQRHGVS